MNDLVNRLNHDYERLHTAKEDAFWTSYMGLAEDADAARDELDRLEIEMKRWLGDPGRLAEVRAGLEKAEGDDAVALRGWLATLEAHAIEGEESNALAEEIIEQEGALARKRSKLKLGFTVPGGEFEPASSNRLAVMVQSDEDEARRRAAWEGLKGIEDFVLSNGFVELVRARNRLGRLQGAEDYYDWKTQRAEGMRKREIFALLDDLEKKTRERGRSSLEALKREHGDDVSAPWNVKYQIAGDVTNEIDPYFPFGKALERWGRSFAALGIDYRGATMILDLVDREGKYENGFMHGPVPPYRDNGTFKPARIHFTANAIPGMVGAGKRATETLFHEGGHAAHFANIDMPAPCFSQEFAPTSVAFAETQSMFLDSVLDDADWQTRYAGMPFELVEKSIRKTQPYAAWTLRSVFAIPYVERAIYEIPDDELSSGRILDEVRRVERELLFLDDASPRPALSVPHLLAGESSAYYHGYVLALMAVHQTRDFFRARDGHLVDNPRIGPDLTRAYWQPGNSRRFPEFVRNLTGAEPAADALARHVNRSAKEAVAEARTLVDQLEKIDRHEGPVELDATIRVVHGHDEVASTARGFEQAAAAFESWVDART